MAGRLPLKQLALLAGGVLVVHLLAADWVAARLAPPSPLQTMGPVMYTRMLAEQAPVPALVVAPAPPPKKKPRPHLPAVQVAKPDPVPPPPPPAEPEPPVEAAKAPAPEPAASAPQQVAEAPTPAASAASAPATPAADRWPADTRVTYRLGGEAYGGKLYGDARVLWQREDGRYQVRVEIDITIWANLVMTSQGEVTDGGLVPRVFEEIRPKKRRSARFEDLVVTLDDGEKIPRPPGMQDTASQFVELAHRFSTGQAALEVGRSITFPMARPGGIDEWTYDIAETEVLKTPNFGDVTAYRLKPRALAKPRGNITAEMWFAPSLQYLPARIKVSMGNEAFVDLLVDRIEQR